MSGTLRQIARPALTGVALLGLFAGCGAAPGAERQGDFQAATAALEAFIEQEMESKGLPALSVALVDDQEIVWSRGFGHADAAGEVPATDETVYRVGSISKLFTDIAIMQLVERGELDLDAPVQRYLDDFRPTNPFGSDITLRQLVSHRSGLVREPPVGHYFDASAPTLAETVASLNGTTLVYEPEQRIKYSNAAIATAGYVLERQQEEPFVSYVQRAVLEPAGMRRSAFEPRPDLAADLATAYMWTYDGREFEAPTFQLGMAPAGSMYSTVTDLGRFLSILFADGETESGRILEAASLEEMLTPQFADSSQSTGFGLGFSISELDGARRIGHGGAIYGFASELAALPDEKLGAVVLTNVDIANTVVQRIANAGLRLMLAVRAGEPLPDLTSTSAVPAELAERIAGTYAAGDRRVELVARPDALYMSRSEGGVRTELRMRGDGNVLVVDDRLAYGTEVEPLDPERIRVGDEEFTRVADRRPDPVPARWRGLIGEYGWDHNTLYVLEKDGQLHALIEWFFLDPLEEVEPGVFRFPDRGLYPGERLVFTVDSRGRATQADVGGVVFPRREVGTEAGVTFRIDPVRPVEELRATALAASPPEETGDFRAPDLVDLSTVHPTIEHDIRYASTNNFMGAVFYDEPKAFLQRPAAEALGRVHERLAEKGYGLLIHDAYRPWYVTKMFWDATPAEMKQFVADPSDGSRHNRGAAVDLTLYDLATSQPVQAVGGYDEFSARSYPDYPGGTSLQRWHRELLRREMEAEGFDVYEFEWWHFDYGDWRSYPVQNLTFDRITAGG